MEWNAIYNAIWNLHYDLINGRNRDRKLDDVIFLIETRNWQKKVGISRQSRGERTGPKIQIPSAGKW